MPALTSTEEVTKLLDGWQSAFGDVTETAVLVEKTVEVNNKTYKLAGLLTRLAEIVELETAAWYTKDPDPFDDRNPIRSEQDHSFGHVMKAIFKDNFANKMISTYLTGRDPCLQELHTVTCRLLYDVIPCLETAAVFQDIDFLIRELMEWSRSDREPISSYATGILGYAMDTQDVAATFRTGNTTLVPLKIKKLLELKEENVRINKEKDEEQNKKCNEEVKSSVFDSNKRHFRDIGKEKIPLREAPKLPTPRKGKRKKTKMESDEEEDDEIKTKRVKDGKESEGNNHDSSAFKLTTNTPNDTPKQLVTPSTSSITQNSTPNTTLSTTLNKTPTSTLSAINNSNSCWAEVEPLVIGTYCMDPLSVEMKQRLILRYLQPMGEYQEFLGHVFDNDVMHLLFYYMDLSQNRDVRLAFEALKYTASILCHKRFSIEFIQAGGVQKLLSVRKPSVAATGVSMCLFYLAYYDEPMERLCLLPVDVLNRLVSYALWLLEYSHESGRLHATMFFSLSFPYRLIVELFDHQDGLRKIFNVVSLLKINNGDERQDLPEDILFTCRQMARHATAAIRRYLEAHLAIKVEQIRRVASKNEGTPPIPETPANKATRLRPEWLQEALDLLINTPSARLSWKPVNELIRLGALNTLVKLLPYFEHSHAFSGRNEILRNILDILTLSCVVIKAQNVLCGELNMLDEDNATMPTVSFILGLASGDLVQEAEVQKAALNVIISAVCGLMPKLIKPAASSSFSSKRKSLTSNAVTTAVSSSANVEDVCNKMWHIVQTNNGIMVLLQLLSCKTPIMEADAIRALACKALVGLSRSDSVKQIISKLPMFSHGILQQMAWDPVLPEKRQEHCSFSKQVMLLVEQVTGKPATHNVSNPSRDRFRKAEIVEKTKISFSKEELLHLIKDYLVSEGFAKTASSLTSEAQLNTKRLEPFPANYPSIQASPTLHSSSFSHSSITPLNHEYFHNKTFTENLAIKSTSETSTINKTLSDYSIANTQQQQQNQVVASTSAISLSPNTVCHTTPLKTTQDVFKTPLPHLASNKLTLKKRLFNKSNFNTPSDFLDLSHIKATNVIKSNDLPKTSIKLSDVVTCYLQHQHSKCSNPVVTCPPFSLLTPHKCPEPKHRLNAPTSIPSRVLKRQSHPTHGGYDGARYDRKLIFSRFRAFKSIRDMEDGHFTCCSFSSDEKNLLLGLYTGEVKVFNVQTSEEVAVHQCHNASIIHCQPSYDDRLLLTSQSWVSPNSSLWRVSPSFTNVTTYAEDQYTEFSKQVQDRVIGTRDHTAHIYDVQTGRLLMELFDSSKANYYTKNLATFNYTDDLVLNDGVLWALDSGKPVHKFDKFNSNVSGLFHPNGLEVIINSQIWDIRMHHLLHTVEALDQCQVRFNKTGSVIYGAIFQEDDMVESQVKNSFGSSFRSFDGASYDNITTFDVKRTIFDLSTDSSDQYLAVIENNNMGDSVVEECTCRLYEIGRVKDDEEDGADEEDENRDEDDEEDDSIDEDDDSRELFDWASEDRMILPSGDEGEEAISTDDEDEDDDESDDADEDDDDVLFELSDMSNF